jgi:hypothetical protein
MYKRTGVIYHNIEGVIYQSKERDLHTTPGKCTSSQIFICKVNLKGFLFLIFYQTRGNYLLMKRKQTISILHCNELEAF